MIILLMTGIGVLLAGILAIAAGIPVKEFSLGNTLILAGAIGCCTGLIIVSLWLVAREMRVALQYAAPDAAPDAAPVATKTKSRAVPRPAPEPLVVSEIDAPQSPLADPSSDGSPPRQEDARDRPRPPSGPEAAAEPAEPVKPRRNLLFSSSRREREAEAGATDDASADAKSVDAKSADARLPPLPPSANDTPPRTAFEDAWPSRSDARRQRTPPQAPPPVNEVAQVQAARQNESVAVTVLKSGVVDGMAYSLYSDGSIEAQMPEGMMRFASIEALRVHLEQRP